MNDVVSKICSNTVALLTAFNATTPYAVAEKNNYPFNLANSVSQIYNSTTTNIPMPRTAMTQYTEFPSLHKISDEVITENMNDKIIIDLVDYNGCRFKFKNPYKFFLRKEENYYIVDDDFLDVHVCEKDKDEVIKSLSQKLAFVYQEYVEETDENLTKGAQSLKNKFKGLIEET